MIAESGGKGDAVSGARVEVGREGSHHVLKVEAAGCACCRRCVVRGEVAITVGVGAGGGDVRGIEDVSIDEGQL